MRLPSVSRVEGIGLPLYGRQFQEMVVLRCYTGGNLPGVKMPPGHWFVVLCLRVTPPARGTESAQRSIRCQRPAGSLVLHLSPAPPKLPHAVAVSRIIPGEIEMPYQPLTDPAQSHMCTCTAIFRDGGHLDVAPGER